MRQTFSINTSVCVRQHIGLDMFSPTRRPKRIYQMTHGVLNLPRNLLLDWMFGHSLINCHVEHHLFPFLSDHMCLKVGGSTLTSLFDFSAQRPRGRASDWQVVGSVLPWVGPRSPVPAILSAGPEITKDSWVQYHCCPPLPPGIIGIIGSHSNGETIEHSNGDTSHSHFSTFLYLITIPQFLHFKEFDPSVQDISC